VQQAHERSENLKGQYPEDNIEIDLKALRVEGDRLYDLSRIVSNGGLL
jgi:hypothetical protein